MLIETLKAYLIQNEGLRLHPYKCTSGKTTIGVGRNLDDNGITTDEAMHLLTNDINNSIQEVEKNIDWYYEAPGNVQLVLADMHFNLGLPVLLSFKNMLKSLKDKKYEEAAEHLLDSRYAKQVGNRALLNARLLETTESEAWQPKQKKI